MHTNFKLLKKSLALLISVALCFSAMVIVASAADATANATVTVDYPYDFESVTVGGEIDVTVTLTSNSELEKTAAAIFNFSVNDGFVIENVAVPDAEDADRWVTKSETGYTLNTNTMTLDDEQSDIERKNVYKPIANTKSGKFLLYAKTVNSTSEKIPTSMSAIITLKMTSEVANPEIVVDFTDACSAGAASEATYSLAGLTETDITVTDPANTAIAVSEAVATKIKGYSADVDADKKFSLSLQFDVAANGTITEKGCLMYTPEAFEAAAATYTKENATANATLSSNGGVTLSGYTLKAITQKNVFVPYAIVNGKLVAGTPVTDTYADLLNKSTTNAYKNNILDTYYIVYDSAPVDNYAKPTAPAADKTYRATTEIVKAEVTGYLYDSTATVKGIIDDMALYMKYGFEAGLTGELEYGVLLNKTTLDGAAETDYVILSKKNDYAVLSNFAISNIATQNTFVPFVKSGNDVKYGTSSKISYVNYLVNTANNTELSASIRSEALAVLDLYETITGEDVYTAQ